MGNPVPKALKQRGHRAQKMSTICPVVPVFDLQDLPGAATEDQGSMKKQEP